MSRSALENMHMEVSNVFQGQTVQSLRLCLEIRTNQKCLSITIEKLNNNLQLN